MTRRIKSRPSIQKSSLKDNVHTLQYYRLQQISDVVVGFQFKRIKNYFIRLRYLSLNF